MALGGLVSAVTDGIKAVRGTEKSLKAGKTVEKAAEKEAKNGVKAENMATENAAGTRNGNTAMGSEAQTGMETQSEKEMSATAKNEDPNKTPSAPINDGDSKAAAAVSRNNEAQKVLKTKEIQKQATRAEYRALHPKAATSLDFARAMGGKIAHSKGARYAMGFEALAMLTGNGMLPFHVLKDAFHVMGFGMDKADQVATGKIPLSSNKQSTNGGYSQGTKKEGHADSQTEDASYDDGFLSNQMDSAADKMMDSNGFSNTTSEMANQVTTNTSTYGQSPSQEYTNDGPEV